MGSLGTMIVIVFLVWLSKNNIAVGVNPVIFASGLLFSLIYAFFAGNNSYIATKFDVYLTPKNTSFTRGLMIFSVMAMSMVLLFVLCCFVAPSEIWPWLEK